MFVLPCPFKSSGRRRRERRKGGEKGRREKKIEVRGKDEGKFFLIKNSIFFFFVIFLHFSFSSFFLSLFPYYFHQQERERERRKKEEKGNKFRLEQVNNMMHFSSLSLFLSFVGMKRRERWKKWERTSSSSSCLLGNGCGKSSERRTFPGRVLFQFGREQEKKNKKDRRERKRGRRREKRKWTRVNGQRLFRHILLFLFALFLSSLFLPSFFLSFSSPIHSLFFFPHPLIFLSSSSILPSSFFFSSSHRVLLELLFSEPELYMFCTDSSFEFLSLYFLQVSFSSVFRSFSFSLTHSLNRLTGTISEKRKRGREREEWPAEKERTVNQTLIPMSQVFSLVLSIFFSLSSYSLSQSSFLFSFPVSFPSKRNNCLDFQVVFRSENCCLVLEEDKERKLKKRERVENIFCVYVSSEPSIKSSSSWWPTLSFFLFFPTVSLSSLFSLFSLIS